MSVTEDTGSDLSSSAGKGMSPARKQQLRQYVLYGVLVLAALGFALGADIEAIQKSFLNTEIAADMFPEVVTQAAKNTLLYTATSFVFGLVFGLLLALMRLSVVAPYRWIARTYIEFFRALPALVTILLIGFAVPIAFDVDIPGGTLGKATLGLGMVAAAYMAETIRAGIEAVPKGQVEAARSLGMSGFWTLTSIVIPQAFRIIIPPLTNELVLLIKDTSLLFVLGTTPGSKELLKFGRDLQNTTFNGTPLIVVAVVYVAITLPLTFLVAQLEKRNKAAL
ncbi:amino acid ABC transporter permease [Euzebya rosea]|uniref:amino acid ABC transporter permease n=1 Tax=Euzebya rosea TaxID=2052804 RepID=UPI00196ACEF5|nr:amino acid ABC transporter permease [Euzebya rosea]